jgi:hypothetical protein
MLVSFCSVINLFACMIAMHPAFYALGCLLARNLFTNFRKSLTFILQIVNIQSRKSDISLSIRWSWSEVHYYLLYWRKYAYNYNISVLPDKCICNVACDWNGQKDNKGELQNLLKRTFRPNRKDIKNENIHNS